MTDLEKMIQNKKANCAECGVSYDNVRLYTYALQELIENGADAKTMLDRLLWYLNEDEVKGFATSRNYCYLLDFEDNSDVAYWLSIDEEELEERKNNGKM